MHVANVMTTKIAGVSHVESLDKVPESARVAELEVSRSKSKQSKGPPIQVLQARASQ